VTADSGPSQTRPYSALPAAAAAHRGKEFGIALGLAHLLQQKLHRFHGGQRVQNLPQNPDSVQFIPGNQQLFLPGSGPIDIDCWEHALIDKFAVEADFHVARTFELFEDDVIHAASGID